MSSVMGLDLSLTSTGVCVIKGGKVVESISLKYKGKISTPEEKTERLIWIVGRIGRIIEENDVEEIVIEGYAHSLRFNQNVMGELHGALKVQLYLKYKIKPIIVQPTVAIKYFTGKGLPRKNKDKYKAKIRDIVNEDLKLNLQTIDELDAFFLAMYHSGESKMKGMLSDQVRLKI